MKIETLRLDTTENNFFAKFEMFKKDFLNILSSSYPSYYGNDYQLKRIMEGQCILYFALIDNTLIGVSYIKRNFRRGGIAIYPEQYRRLGVAEILVNESLKDFPQQYSILNANNLTIQSLMTKIGFKKAKSIEEIKEIVKDEFHQLSHFKALDGCMIFKRKSLRRSIERETLLLLHTY